MPFGIKDSFDPGTDMVLQDVYAAYCTQAQQIPTAGDTWYNVSVDTIDDIVPGVVEIVEDGDERLTQITFLEDGNFQVSVSFEYVRNGNNVGFATIFGARLINGIQVGNTTATNIEGFSKTKNFILQRTFSFSAGDVLSYQIAYDDSEDEAGLQKRELPAGLTGNLAPCFSVSVSRWIRA